MKTILVVAALAACGKSDKPVQRTNPNQSAKAAMELMCNAPEKSKATSNAELAIWIGENIHNDEVLAMVRKLGDLDQKGADSEILKMATQHGVSPCPVIGASPL